jgi:hypothetical protein
MTEFRFDRNESTPYVSCLITGPRRTSRVLLVFDTGCAKTQLREETLAELGFREADRVGTARSIGVEGVGKEGPVYKASRFFVFGKRFTDWKVAGFSMKSFIGKEIDGLLGWDIIRELHVEMDGPQGILKIY